MKRYQCGIFLMLSTVLVGCGGGTSSPSAAASPSKKSLKNITLYDMEQTKKEWFGNGWKSAILNNLDGIEKGDLVTTSTTESEPAQGKPVGVVLNKNTVTMRQVDSFHKSLNMLVLTDSELTIAAGSTLHVERLAVKGSTIKAEGRSLKVSSGILEDDGVIEGNLNFEDFSGEKYFPDSKTFEMRDGLIRGEVTIPSYYTLSGYGTIEGRLVNNGNLSLTSGKTLMVGGGFDQTASGVMNVILTDKHDIVLLNVGREPIQLQGKIIISLKNKKPILAGTRYQLCSTKGALVVNNLTKVLDNNFMELKQEGNDYILEFKKDKTSVVAKMSRKSKAVLSMAQSVAYENLHLSAVQNEKHPFGVYALNTAEKQDFIAYAASGFGQFRLAHFFHVGSCTQEDLSMRMMSAKVEMMRTFDMSSLRISPKIMVGYEQFLSFESAEDSDFTMSGKGDFVRGVGLDIFSKTHFKEIPVDFFASLNMKSGNGEAFILDNEISSYNVTTMQIGFRAVVAEKSHIYGELKLDSCEGIADRRFEVGLQVKI